VSVTFWDGIVAAEDTELMAGLLDNITTSRNLTADDAAVIGYTGRDYATNPWELVSFDGRPMPGLCEVKGVTKCNVKNKKAPGSKGNKPTSLGYAPSEFDVMITVWTPSQWKLLQSQLDRLWNIPMGKPSEVLAAVDAKGRIIPGTKQRIDPAQIGHSIDHPALQALKIINCVINQVGIPHNGSVVGTKVVEMKCTENRDPGKKNHTATPKPGQVKRDPNFDGPKPKNSSQLLPPSHNPANMSLVPPVFTPSGGTS
jgi:hypothetical protein